MEIIDATTYAYVRGPIPVQAVATLRQTLRYRAKGYQHTRLYQLGRWDGWITLITAMGGGYAFPAGLLPRALDALRTTGLEPTVTYQRVPLTPESVSSVLPDGTHLYEDQHRAVVTASQLQRGLLALATNFGKTEVIAGVSLAFPKHQLLVIVDTRTLLTQTADRLALRTGEPVGKYGAGWHQTRERIIVATIQSLGLLLKKQPTTPLFERPILIVDEVHTVSPTLWFPVLGACTAPVRLGLSGTVRESSSALVTEAYFGPVLAEVTERELVAQGRSAEPVILMPIAHTPWNGVQAEYRELYDALIVRNKARNRLLVSAVAQAYHHSKLTALVLCYRLEHGAHLAKLLQEAGVPTGEVNGHTPPNVLDQVRRGLDAGALGAVCASVIWNKGVDIPSVDLVVNAAAWKSAQATAQKLGRGLRKKPRGPNRVIVIDPFDIGSPLLTRHSEARERLYRRRGFPVQRGSLDDLLPPALAYGVATPA